MSEREHLRGRDLAAKLAAALLLAGTGFGLPGVNAQTASSPVLEVPARSGPVPSTVSPREDHPPAAAHQFFDRHLGK